MTDWTSRRPADIVPARPFPTTEIMTAGSRGRVELIHQVHMMQRRGELGPHTSEVRAIRDGWAVKVVRLREPTPRWRRVLPWAVGSALAAGVTAWALIQLVTAMLAALAGVASVWWPLGLLALIVLAVTGGGRAAVVIVKVTIK